LGAGACAPALQGGGTDIATEAAQVLAWIGELYGIERSAKKNRLDDDARQALRAQSRGRS